MTDVRTIEAIEAALSEYIPVSAQTTGKQITLGRMERLMTALGNPEKRLKVIHIAGTSGKTSTTYYIAALLTAAGKKTGMTVSPHVDSVTERLQINMQPLSDIEFGTALQEMLEIIATLDFKPSYFEILIALAYWYFVKEEVDYAVIETGMGGLHDGTNIANNLDKLCVITDIGYDHMHVLGSTLSEIAAQKAGIIHHANNVYMYNQSTDIMQAIEQRCSEQNATMHIVPQLYNLNAEPPSALSDYQQRNWQLAFAVYCALQQQDSLVKLSAQQLSTVQKVQVPARMDIKKIGSKTIILDGAHNEQKMSAFIGSYTQIYPSQEATVLLSLKHGKDYAEVLPLLRAITSVLILTTFSTAQDMPIKSIDTALLQNEAIKLGFKKVMVKNDQNEALDTALNQTGDIVIVTGSFYLIGQLRAQNPELKN